VSKELQLTARTLLAFIDLRKPIIGSFKIVD
jgi:hypothetical protein